ncbi:MAG: type II secretion system F family protein [Pseudomonadota bacterium]
MTQQDILIYGIAGLVFLGVICVGFLLTTDDQTYAAKKRAKLVGSGETGTVARSKNKAEEETNARRRETQKMLEKLRQDDNKRKSSIVPQDIKGKIEQAGLSMSVSTFWLFSVAAGVALAGLAFLSGAEGLPTIKGIKLENRAAVVAMAGLAGSLGLPRWILGFLSNRRAKKMTNQFADALDVIVRGVKSGLPLTECLRIVAKESPAPLGPEFEALTDQVAMGTSMERALLNLYHRVPLPEINFFVIVLSIQTKAGGNLSEALGNLSTVIRARRMMREKVKALSSEAKASAMIIGCLPFGVGSLLYVTSPDYMSRLFTTETGHLFILIGLVMMAMGTTVMKKMMNFNM